MGTNFSFVMSSDLKCTHIDLFNCMPLKAIPVVLRLILFGFSKPCTTGSGMRDLSYIVKLCLLRTNVLESSTTWSFSSFLHIVHQRHTLLFLKSGNRWSKFISSFSFSPQSLSIISMMGLGSSFDQAQICPALMSFFRFSANGSHFSRVRSYDFVQDGWKAYLLMDSGCVDILPIRLYGCLEEIGFWRSIIVHIKIWSCPISAFTPLRKLRDHSFT